MALKFYNASKVLLYVKEYEAKTPVFLEIDPALRCNQSCVWCRYSHNGNTEILSYDFMVRKLAKYPHVKGVRITGGGEPLMNADTVKFIKECANRGIQVGIETNGALLTNEEIDVISRCCRYCRISLDAATNYTYERLHRTPDFEKVVENIRKLYKAKVRELGVSYLVVSKNVEDIAKLGLLGLTVDYIHFKPLISGIDEITKKQAIDTIESNHYFKDIPARYDRLIQDEICNNKLPCRISELIRRIGGDGKEYVCCEKSYQPEFEVGVWDGDTSKCLSCRYNGYNEVLESYYSNSMAKELI